MSDQRPGLPSSTGRHRIATVSSRTRRRAPVRRRSRRADGLAVRFAGAAALAPAGLDQSELSYWVYANCRPGVVVVSGREMPVVMLRESLLLGAAAAVAAVAATSISLRRRPY